MKKLLKRYGGLIFFYATIVSMVWIVSMRFNYLNKVEQNQIAYLEQAK